MALLEAGYLSATSIPRWLYLVGDVDRDDEHDDGDDGDGG